MIHALTRSSLLLAFFTASVAPALAAPADEAARILAETGVRGGLVVHLGSGSGKLTAALRANDSYQVHGLDADAAAVATARRNIRALDLYGPVSVDQLQGDRLPYTDNLVNLLVAENLGNIPMAEVIRVLVPEGVAYIRTGEKWKKTIKPRPSNIDDWTHFLHDASGNAVAHDTVVGPPRHLQWVGSPRWSRHHDRMASMSALVSGGGRLFYVMDEGSRVSIQLPPKWTLIGRDAFNGVVLWKRKIDKWHSHLWPLKSGPTQLARRLVTDGDHVYVTLGIDAPLVALDAATGKTLRTYKGSDGAEEVIHLDGVIVVAARDGPWELHDYAPKAGQVGDQARAAKESRWNQKPRRLMAFDAASGRLLWQKQTIVAPLTLAAGGDQVVFHDNEKVVCVDRVSGAQKWASTPAPRRSNMTFNFGPKLVVYKNVVLYAGGDRKMRALKLGSGEQLWEEAHARGGYLSPEDLLVTGGLVWSAPTTSGRDSGVFTGRDPLTGEVKTEFPPNVETYWFHHRCYIAKATDNYLMPSRTGIEFVDYKKKDWEIHHWVRGGCLYGVMPCNGMVYAPPHNCACYPEAKLFGLNALAPASPTRPAPRKIPAADRFEFGSADVAPAPDQSAGPGDWPTFRGNQSRSGFTKSKVSADLQSTWQTEIGGRLSATTIAHGKLFVAQIDAHTVHALDAQSGKKLWDYTTGGRVDSPPTYHKGQVLFGSADGWVYCLRARDGKLAWRFRAAPEDRRVMAFEQLESVWPVHGSVLVRDDIAYFVAGRSNFLDTGLRFYRIGLGAKPKVLGEVVIDDTDPETGKNLQDRLQVLNMPVGLTDVLSADDKHIYMRSQRFDLTGRRQEIGPHSGDPVKQASVQKGEGAHLFSPTGFLDGSYFHRSYWVYGKSFAGGHSGYSKAGKFAPAGRILVHDDKKVYGYGRKPQYFRWTTTLEHQLFAADKQAPDVPASPAGKGPAARGTPAIRFETGKSLDPTGKALAVEAWVKTDKPAGVILARGGPAEGFALLIQGGKPRFVVRAKNEASSVTGPDRIVGKWTHLAGILTAEKKLELYVNGQRAATAKATGLIASDPKQPMEIGADDVSAVGDYQSPLAFSGTIDEVRLYYGTVTADDIRARHATPATAKATGAKLVLACSFDKGGARDTSGLNHHGSVQGVRATIGKVGGAMRFLGAKKRPTRNKSRDGGSFVKRQWAEDTPVYARAMVLAGDTLFVAGPPDLMDEEQTFAKLAAGDKSVQATLAQQDAALAGAEGARLIAVSVKDGKTVGETSLTSLPAWDGMAAANGKLFLTTADGRIICFGSEK
ncbi:MAG: PQQ-binding-like beta-propeller repeat protein [Phycisphaerae bacterium]|nr:PQQ-binding-like beta-propeller repeat protein [Phycisphaerae bacterium]